MGRPKITFTLGQGGSGGPASGTDYICGLHLYGPAPGSFATTACQAVFSLSDAVTKGITNTNVGETKSRAIITISGTVVVGDTIQIVVTETNPNSKTTAVNLGTATVATAATATGAATDVAAKINSGTYLHGYTATSSSGVVTLIARAGLGINLNPAVNATPVATTTVGSATVAITQQFGTGSGGATAGIYSPCNIWYYQIKRFFDLFPNGKLWVRFASSVDAAYADIVSLQNAANGECKRLAIYSFVAKTAGNVTSDLNLMQAQVNILFTGYQPLTVFFAPNIKAISDLSTLDNLQNTATAKDCIPIISQDGDAAGAQLFVNSGVSISNIGAILGKSASVAVSQNMGEVGTGSISNGVEDNNPAFSNGTLVGSVSNSLLDTLNDYRYCYCVTYANYPGTFINNDWTAIAQTNAYNRVVRSLTIQKVLRQQYIALLPLLKSRIYLNADGTMDIPTLNRYIGAAEPGIEAMVKDGDLSPGNISGTALTDGVVVIDPTQNVNTQGYIAISYNLLAVNIADNINVTLQFVQTL